MNGPELALAGVVFLGAVTQGVLGFGFGLVVMSIAPRILGLTSAVPFTALFGVCVAAWVFWRYRRHASWQEIGPLLLGGALGLPLGVLALRSLDPEPCVRALGGSIVLYVGYAVWPRRTGPARPPVRRRWAPPAGFVAGLFGGAFAMGGPPVITYATARRYSPATFKAVLQGYFVTASATHLVLLGTASLLTTEVLRTNLLLAPALPLGLWVGARYGDRLHPSLFRRIVLGVLLALGVGYLVTGR